MGLDMYLNRMPRYKNVTAEQVSTIEAYLEWLDRKTSNNYDGSFQDWCGLSLKNLPPDSAINFYKQFYTTKYYIWDKEKKYGNVYIMEEVAYWRKANAIHLWFVDNVQGGIDDCKWHQEVTKEILEELLETCQKVYDNCQMVINETDEWEVIDVRGSLAEELLPTTSGFFFGYTDYDYYYVNSIKNTIDMITTILETTDFDKQMIYYISSW